MSLDIFIRLADAYEDSLEQFNESHRRAVAARRNGDLNRGPYKPRCKKCGLKIRRPGHENGQDHLRRASKD